MKTYQKPKDIFARYKPWPKVAIGGLGIAVLGILFFDLFFRDFAAETARPLEVALVKSGAVKQCSRSALGRGPDNLEPWYYAVYEVPGSREEATDSVRAATKEAGYNLTNGPEPVNVEDNKFYSDQASKKSPYIELKPGNVDLELVVFGSQIYNGESGSFCGVTKNDNPPKDKTTIRLTINLPKFGR